MYCKHCGKEVNPEADICIHCGRSLKKDITVTKDDSRSFGWGVLAFFIPVVGLVLFLVWRDIKPKCAKSAGIGGLIGFVITIILYVFIILFYIEFLKYFQYNFIT